MILANQIKCLKCGDEPFSSGVHDCASCKCGAVAADGGMAYLRRVGNPENYIDISIVVPDLVFDNCMSALDWCDDTGRNNLGRVCAIFRAMRDTGFLHDNI